MNGESETLGLCFFREGTGNKVFISPGLANLLHGNTSRTSIKRDKIYALPETRVVDRLCRIMSVRGKCIALFEQGAETAFKQVCIVLTGMGEAAQGGDGTPRKVSVDAMVLGIEKGTVADRYGCIIASEHHEVVVYEDRGEDMSFLKVPRHDQAIAAAPESSPGTMSGSERLQTKETEARELQQQRHRLAEREEKSKSYRDINSLYNAMLAPHSTSHLNRQAVAVENLLRKPPRKPEPPLLVRTRADKGQVSPPSLPPATTPRGHAINAFLEFQSVIKAIRKVNLTTCKNILQPVCQSKLNLMLLDKQLEEAEAAIYDNDTGRVIKGTMSGSYMAAYNVTDGFVALDERETQRLGRLKFQTPKKDPVVVTARCTRIMLDDRVLEKMKFLSGSSVAGTTWEQWTMPTFEWVNGVPGCGKTKSMVDTFDESQDLIATTTLETAKDLRQRLGPKARARVRTIASILGNGFRGSESFKRLTVDEALMNHFGAIVMAARLSGVVEVTLVGDNNQLPYIDRENLFAMEYCRPNHTVGVGKQLYCTHRCPMDVVYALKQVYPGMYSSSSRVRSLEIFGYKGVRIPTALPNTLYITYTQEEKKSLITQGFGSGTGSRTLTIHESQGLTSERVYIIQTKSYPLRLHESVPHAVVALSRHTELCAYFSDQSGDVIGRLVRAARAATTEQLREHNLAAAMSHRDMAVARNMADSP